MELICREEIAWGCASPVIEDGRYKKTVSPHTLIAAEIIKGSTGIVLLVQSLAVRERMFLPRQRLHHARARSRARCCRA